MLRYRVYPISDIRQCLYIAMLCRYRCIPDIVYTRYQSIPDIGFTRYLVYPISGIYRYRVSLKSAPISVSISQYTDIGVPYADIGVRQESRWAAVVGNLKKLSSFSTRLSGPGRRAAVSHSAPAGRARTQAGEPARPKCKMPPPSESVEAAGRRVEKPIFDLDVILF
jgi:hypothetical protein